LKAKHQVIQGVLFRLQIISKVHPHCPTINLPCAATEAHILPMAHKVPYQSASIHHHENFCPPTPKVVAVVFKPRAHYIAQAGVEIEILLPQPPVCWNDRRGPPRPPLFLQFSGQALSHSTTTCPPFSLARISTDLSKCSVCSSLL
jgi:hypothetical protein